MHNITTASTLNLSNIAVLRNESRVMDDVTDVLPHYLDICPSRVHCDRLGADCIDCEFNSSCRYGANVSAVCHVKPQIICSVCTIRIYNVFYSSVCKVKIRLDCHDRPMHLTVIYCKQSL